MKILMNVNNKALITYLILLFFLNCKIMHASDKNTAAFNLTSGLSSGVFIFESSTNDGNFNQFFNFGLDLRTGVCFNQNTSVGLLFNYFFILGNIEKGTEELSVQTRYNRFDIAVIFEKLFSELFFVDVKIGTALKIIMTRTIYENHTFKTTNDRNGIRPGFVIGPGFGFNIGKLIESDRRINIGLRQNYYRSGNRDDFYIGGFLEFQLL